MSAEEIKGIMNIYIYICTRSLGASDIHGDSWSRICFNQISFNNHILLSWSPSVQHLLQCVSVVEMKYLKKIKNIV